MKKSLGNMDPKANHLIFERKFSISNASRNRLDPQGSLRFITLPPLEKPLEKQSTMHS
jgi:hypothetical protein